MTSIMPQPTSNHTITPAASPIATTCQCLIRIRRWPIRRQQRRRRTRPNRNTATWREEEEDRCLRCRGNHHTGVEAEGPPLAVVRRTRQLHERSNRRRIRWQIARDTRAARNSSRCNSNNSNNPVSKRASIISSEIAQIYEMKN